MRLDRFLVKASLGGRKAAHKLIFSGRVKVNGQIVKIPSFKVDPDSDVVEVDDSIVSFLREVHIAVYKPVGYVTSTSDPTHPVVLDLVADLPFKGRLFPAGRLDKDAEGLVILTSDGELAHILTHPRYHVPKTYLITLKAPLGEDKIEAIRKGKVILADGYNPKPADVEVIEPLAIKITVFEGKYHLVKRIIAASGSRVLRLKRIAIGPLTLVDLKEGEWRMISDDELRELKEFALKSIHT